MVEVNLQALDEAALNRDYYVSVRVGEVQKLSRAATSRAYKFPPAAVKDHRFGKVEVFRRLGGCTVNIKDSEPCEVSVPMDGFPEGMKFRVDLGKTQNVQKKAEMDMIEAKPLKDSGSHPTKIAAAIRAKEYLDSHQLEVRLSDAMMAVLREKPEDPADFIAKRLANSAPCKNEGASDLAQAPKVPKLPLGEMAGQKKEKAVPAAATAVNATVPAAPTTKWQLKPSVGTWLQGPKLAPKPQPQPEVPTPKAKEVSPFSSAKYCHLPSVGTWHLKPHKPPTLASAAPAAVKESTATAATVSVNDAIAPSPAAATTQCKWQLKPSVGTWLMPKLQVEQQPAAAPAPAVEAAVSTPPAAAAAPQIPWRMKPSVGTWLIVKAPPCEEQVAPVHSAGRFNDVSEPKSVQLVAHDAKQAMASVDRCGRFYAAPPPPPPKKASVHSSGRFSDPASTKVVELMPCDMKQKAAQVDSCGRFIGAPVAVEERTTPAAAAEASKECEVSAVIRKTPVGIPMSSLYGPRFAGLPVGVGFRFM
eukprot:gnl/TRDRNA2_/TRDRNA2_170232_c0_seq1.p1 gnl/TRDRNA2_/TRDRNA2_170232_c0~~gnl/TRDRNA2_/TRDRNA2_170232_c0_seq1.p1  ORF type:complete len:530 (+),score=141.49 gnl/TRDRNA2_/TRDRNA2_170232_c0_seq1:94-1683(+)